MYFATFHEDSRIITTIEVDDVQALATDHFGAPLTEDELRQVVDIFDATDKSYLITSAIRQVRSEFVPEKPSSVLCGPVVSERLANLPAEFALNSEVNRVNYIPYEIDPSETIATIEVTEIQAIAEDVHGRPLTDNELYHVAILFAEANKFDLLHDAIGELLSRMI